VSILITVYINLDVTRKLHLLVYTNVKEHVKTAA